MIFKVLNWAAASDDKFLLETIDSGDAMVLKTKKCREIKLNSWKFGFK